MGYLPKIVPVITLVTMTLYLKYRPQKIAELDLVMVRTTLQKIISSGKIPHAFLFAGVRGTGKTSSARILAKVINCENPKDGEPCNKCEQCVSITKGTNIDVIEMDAASNRGIDDVRILRENVKLAPLKAPKKIYIIDEAHMLTTEAANALLKTLEEPPEHVIFILATTNPEKLPATIHSRLTVVNFHKASQAEVLASLTRVAQGEKLDLEDGVLELIFKACDGSFREAVKTLEQLSLKLKKLTKKEVEEVLFEGSLNVDTLLGFLAKKQISQALMEVERVTKDGSIKIFKEEIEKRLHEALLAKYEIKKQEDLKDFSKEQIVNLLELLGKYNAHAVLLPQLSLELAIVAWGGGGVVSEKKDETAPEKETIPEEKKTQEIPVEVKGEIDTKVWGEILTNMRVKNASIEALLRAAKPMGFDGKTLTVGVYYKFHKERLEAGTNRRTLEEVIAKVCGNPITVACLLTERPPMPVKSNEPILTEPRGNDIINAAKEIFGS